MADFYSATVRIIRPFLWPTLSPTGLLDPRYLNDFQLCYDQVDEFADVLTDHTQFAAALRTGVSGIERAALARCLRRDAWDGGVAYAVR